MTASSSSLEELDGIIFFPSQPNNPLSSSSVAFFFARGAELDDECKFRVLAVVLRFDVDASLCILVLADGPLVRFGGGFVLADWWTGV